MGHFEPVMEWVEDDDDNPDFNDEQAELEALAEVEDCHCGAKVVGSDGRVTFIADCCC